MKKPLTQAQLKSVLNYDPETGHFTRLIDGKRKHTKAGEIAGYIKTQGYIDIHVNGCNYYAHRLAFLYMTGSFPKELVDHINGIKTDNRWINLRPASYSENNRNARLRKDNKSGFKGVCWDRGYKKWVAYVYLNKTRHDLGLFDSLDDAAKVVDQVRKQLHGAFAAQSTITTIKAA